MTEVVAPRRRGGLFWHRDFRLLWFGESVSMLGDAMASVAMPLVAVSVLHASVLTVSAITGATYLPYLLFGLPAGAWVDRLKSRTVLVASDLAALVLYASLPVAYAVGSLTAAHLLAVAFLAGTANMFFGSAYNIYLRDLVPSDDLIEGNAKLQGSGSVTSIGGPGLGGIASQLLGSATTLLFDAGSFLVSAVCILRIGQPGERVERPARTTTIPEEIREGVRFVLRDPYLRALTLWATFCNLGLAGYFGLTVVFLVRTVGLTAGEVGVIMTIGGIGGLAGALAARRLTKWLGTARTLVINCSITAPCGLLIAAAAKGPRLVFCLVGILALEGGLVLGTVILSAFRQIYCPPEMLGRVGTSMRMVTYGTAPVGALVAGALGETLGPRRGLLIMLSLSVVALVFLLTSPFARLRDMPPPAATASVVQGMVEPEAG